MSPRRQTPLHPRRRRVRRPLRRQRLLLLQRRERRRRRGVRRLLHLLLLHVAVVGAETGRPVALVLLLLLKLLLLLLLAEFEASVPADGVGGGGCGVGGAAPLRGVAADVHGAGVGVAAAPAAGDARHPGAAADHPGGDVLLVAVLHVHDEFPGAIGATAVPHQKRLPPRRRLGLLVEVFGLLQLILPRLRGKNERLDHGESIGHYRRFKTVFIHFCNWQFFYRFQIHF